MLRRLLMYLAVAAVVTLSMTAAASAEPGSSAARPVYQKQVFVRGAAIHGANGLAVDGRGRLLVASFAGGELVALDGQSGRIVDRLGHELGVDAPDDVAVGPDGSIYWTDLLLGQVGRLAPNGVVTKQFVAPGMNPIAFTADGRLFVGQAFAGDGLYELDPNLVRAPRVVIPDSGVAPFPRQLNGFDFGPDGMLYAPQPFLGTIVRIDPDSGAMTPVTDAFAGRFPSSLEFDSRGRLYASLGDGAVVRVDRDTGTYKVVAEIPAGLDNMVFGPRDRLYVSSYENGGVYVVGPGGRVRTLSRGGLILPGGLAVMRDDSGGESLFVADPWKLAQFDERSGALLDVDRASPAGGGIVPPLTVAPDGRNVIITSWLLSSAVQLWDPLAKVAVDTFTDFAVPLNAIRFRGDLIVAELGTGSVTRRDATGTRSVIASGLAVPAGLAATAGDLWVADEATGIVWKLVEDGAVLASPRLTARGLHSPEGMAVDRDGSLLVVEAGDGRLSRIDPATGQVTTVAHGLRLGLRGSAAAPPTWALSSVAVGRNGTIFVTGDIANVIYRLRPLHHRAKSGADRSGRLAHR